jgi:hypothetical protein
MITIDESSIFVFSLRLRALAGNILDRRRTIMLNDSIPLSHPLEWLNPALDFTQDTAFVGVKIPPVSGNSITGQALVVTSGRRVIPWNAEKGGMRGNVIRFYW